MLITRLQKASLEFVLPHWHVTERLKRSFRTSEVQINVFISFLFFFTQKARTLKGHAIACPRRNPSAIVFGLVNTRHHVYIRHHDIMFG